MLVTDGWAAAGAGTAGGRKKGAGRAGLPPRSAWADLAVAGRYKQGDRPSHRPGRGGAAVTVGAGQAPPSAVLAAVCVFG